MKEEIKRFDYEMRGVKLKSIQCVKDLDVKIVSNLKFSHQCIDTAIKAKRMVGFINPMEVLRVERPSAERAVLLSEASFLDLSCQIGRHIVLAVRYEYEGGARLTWRALALKVPHTWSTVIFLLTVSLSLRTPVCESAS